VTAPDRLPPATPSVLQRLALAPRRVRALRGQIERARVHSGPLDAALATIARDSEIGGPILAGAVASRLFVFGLPLGFFLVSGLGVLARVLGTNGAVRRRASRASSGDRRPTRACVNVGS
jgi:hypothetical protein